MYGSAQTSKAQFWSKIPHSVAMIKHSMTLVQAIVQYLNPGQVPVLAADQPLYYAYPSKFNGAGLLLLERTNT